MGAAAGAGGRGSRYVRQAVYSQLPELRAHLDAECARLSGMYNNKNNNIIVYIYENNKSNIVCVHLDAQCARVSGSEPL
jgi:hypothetical protein